MGCQEGENVQERLHLGNGPSKEEALGGSVCSEVLWPLWRQRAIERQKPSCQSCQGMLQKHYMHRIAREDESLGEPLNCVEALESRSSHQSHLALDQEALRGLHLKA